MLSGSWEIASQCQEYLCCLSGRLKSTGEKLRYDDDLTAGFHRSLKGPTTIMFIAHHSTLNKMPFTHMPRPCHFPGMPLVQMTDITESALDISCLLCIVIIERYLGDEVVHG